MSIDVNNKTMLNILSSNVFPSNEWADQKEPQHNTNKGSSWLVVHCMQQLNKASKGKQDFFV